LIAPSNLLLLFKNTKNTTQYDEIVVGICVSVKELFFVFIISFLKSLKYYYFLHLKKIINVYSSIKHVLSIVVYGKNKYLLLQKFKFLHNLKIRCRATNWGIYAPFLSCFCRCQFKNWYLSCCCSVFSQNVKIYGYKLVFLLKHK
jgi:hypothetical protein